MQSGESKEGEEFTWRLAGGRFAFSKGNCSEQQVGSYTVTSESDILRIFKSEGNAENRDTEDKDKAPIAFFRAPATISTVNTSGAHIVVGCQNGEVLQLRAAVLLTV